MDTNLKYILFIAQRLFQSAKETSFTLLKFLDTNSQLF